MKPRLLLTSICSPHERILQYSATDQMAYRLTREQDLFCLYLHTHASPLHLLAQNVQEPSVVLENPTLDDLRDELCSGYQYVAISFDMLYAERLLEMCALIRSAAPRAQIIIGGYGAICAPKLLEDPRWRGMFDHVCRGEGVAFLRGILGDRSRGPLHCRIPKEGAGLPWLNPRPVGTTGIILSGLGCTQRCPFCTTSAYTRGRYVELMNATDIHRAMYNYWRYSPFTNSVTIYDENFLDHREKVMALGELLRSDREFGLSKYSFSAFGSLKALAKYEPEELLLSGLDKAWVGVESKFSNLAKRRDHDPQTLFPLLHSVGIKTIGSWIIGQDSQTKENIEEDIDYFVSLDPCFQQLSILTVMPGTPLHAAYLKRGRIPKSVPWNQYHLYGETYKNESFSHPEMRRILQDTYRRIYCEHGPALMKSLEVNLNGYAWCAGSKHPALKNDRAAHFRDRCRSYHPMVKTALEFAPSSRVRSRVADLQRRYVDLFGSPTVQEEALAEKILRKAVSFCATRNGDGDDLREEPFRRYTYPAQSHRPVGRPYSVEYPRSHNRPKERALAS